MFTASHDYLITDENLQTVQTAHTSVVQKRLVSHDEFKKIWSQAKRILSIIIWLPFLPKNWSAIINALLAAGDTIALDQQPDVPVFVIPAQLPTTDTVEPVQPVQMPTTDTIQTLQPVQLARPQTDSTTV